MSDVREEITFRIFNIEDYTTSNDNNCLKVHGQPTSENGDFTLWVFKDDWINELKRRESDYLGEEFEVLITDKTGGSRNHVWAEYFWPTDEKLKKVWFDKYLESRDISLEKPSEDEVENILKAIGENYGMSFDDDIIYDGSAEQSENEESKNNKGSEPDKNTRIERQAAMHFASRIVGAKIQSDDIMTSAESLKDESIEEELNKWMRKFQRGVTTGKLQ